jgi:hypothetical protein
MSFILCILPKFLIAGGASFLGTLELPSNPVVNNYTLAGEKIPSTQVVCRDRWGTPMLPNGMAGYSVIAPIKKNLIAQSLWVPPVQGERPIKAPLVAPPSPVASPVVAVPASASGPVPVLR